MNNFFSPSLDQLKKIPVVDNREPMVLLNDHEPLIKCMMKFEDMLPFTGKGIFVRSSVRDKILAAQAALALHDPSLKLCIVYGYRHPHVQLKYYLEMQKHLKESRIFIDDQSFDEEVHQFIAHPSVAGHPTGGAIDITLLQDEKEVDMGTKIIDFSQPDKIKTFSPKISEKQQGFRMLLLSTLIGQGFSPFYGEWWHFSYGDKEWAAFYHYPNAIYEQLEFSTFERTV